jgi:hypothetical protein
VGSKASRTTSKCVVWISLKKIEDVFSINIKIVAPDITTTFKN